LFFDGGLATLRKFSDFVLVLHAIILILILGFQQMVTPGVVCLAAAYPDRD
jgi:hypothetical protein